MTKTFKVKYKSRIRFKSDIYSNETLLSIFELLVIWFTHDCKTCSFIRCVHKSYCIVNS